MCAVKRRFLRSIILYIEKYTLASQARQASLSPFVLSVDGLMARELYTVKRVASKLATKWGRSYGEVMGWGPEEVRQGLHVT